MTTKTINNIKVKRKVNIRLTKIIKRDQKRTKTMKNNLDNIRKMTKIINLLKKNMNIKRLIENIKRNKKTTNLAKKKTIITRKMTRIISLVRRNMIMKSMIKTTRKNKKIAKILIKITTIRKRTKRTISLMKRNMIRIIMKRTIMIKTITSSKRITKTAKKNIKKIKSSMSGKEMIKIIKMIRITNQPKRNMINIKEMIQITNRMIIIGLTKTKRRVRKTISPTVNKIRMDQRNSKEKVNHLQVEYNNPSINKVLRTRAKNKLRIPSELGKTKRNDQLNKLIINYILIIAYIIKNKH